MVCIVKRMLVMACYLCVYLGSWNWLRADADCADEGEVDYATTIAAIVHDKCTPCHREGQSAPFPLTNYAEVARHAETIVAVLDSGYMPPWKPIDHGLAFANDRRLSQSQRQAFQEWLLAKCPEGDPQQAPTPPVFPDGWSLGKPDVVLRMEESFTVPADGADLYRTFVFKADLPEDAWIKAIELKPTARGAVHHALFFADTEQMLRHVHEKDGKPGVGGMNFFRGAAGGKDSLTKMTEGFARGLGGYVPGTTPNRLPEDLARFLPKGSDILMQTHFHPTGKVEVEQAEIGLYLTKTPPSKRLLSLQMPALFGVGAGIDVPAGKSDFEIHESLTLPFGVKAYEIGGHAHYICKKMSMVATFPDGSTQTLLQIDDWDLDWQDQYLYATPIELPAGTVLDTRIVYDNSAKNPENPNSPPKRIAWGRQSEDEMGSITLTGVAMKESDRPQLEKLLQKRSADAIRNRVKEQSNGFGLPGGGKMNGGLLKLLDRNRDGELESSEIPERFRDRLMDLVDRDGNERLDKNELEAFRKQIQELMDR